MPENGHRDSVCWRADSTHILAKSTLVQAGSVSLIVCSLCSASSKSGQLHNHGTVSKYRRAAHRKSCISQQNAHTDCTEWGGLGRQRGEHCVSDKWEKSVSECYGIPQYTAGSYSIFHHSAGLKCFALRSKVWLSQGVLGILVQPFSFWLKCGQNPILLDNFEIKL